ncbi:trichohyalin-like [Ostrinia nubilalis]|uniref:trichohyalin-like n=1 Tax=Ostrinia nubilalis TaxID=29057 RepID=UPI0030826190
MEVLERNRIWSDMQRSRQENEQRRREQAARDNMDDRLIDVLLRSRARVEQKRKQTEKDGDEGRLGEESHLVGHAALAVGEQAIRENRDNCLIDVLLRSRKRKQTEKDRGIWSDMQRSCQENEQRRREPAARDNVDDRLIDVLLRSRARVEQKWKQTEKDTETKEDLERNRIWSDMQRSRQENEQRRWEQAARDNMDDRLIDVLLRSRARVEQKRKQTEKDVKEEKLRVLEKISQKLESGDAAREAKDLAILNKAIKEKEAIAEARRAADERKQQAFRDERVAQRQRFLRDEAQRLKDFNTMRQWEIMNRFKNAELYDDFQENLRKEKERKIQEYRADILRLWKERDDREARERAETRYFYGELAEKKLRDADNKLLTHAAALVEEAEAHDRPPLALHRAVDRYCKLYRLYPMPDLPSSMQEHFKRYAPWDGSRPDAGYQAPAPPPPDRGPDAPDEDETEGTAGIDKEPAPGRRDGLQQRYAPWDGSRPDAGYQAPAPPPPDRGPDAPDEDETEGTAGTDKEPAPGRRDGLQQVSLIWQINYISICVKRCCPMKKRLTRPIRSQHCRRDGLQ